MELSGACHYQIFHIMATDVKKAMTDMRGAFHNGQRAFDVKTGCNRCQMP